MRSDPGLFPSRFSGLQPVQDVEPLDFGRRFLQFHGAAVEKDQAGLEVLIPEEISDQLGIPEHIRIFQDKPETEENEPGSFVLTYGAPLLEKMLADTLQKKPLVFCDLRFDYIKSAGFERLLGDQLAFYGAVASIETVAATRTRYVLLTYRYTAQSDEQKEGLLSMALNAETGAFVPDMAGMLENAGCWFEYKTPPEGSQELIASLQTHVERYAGKMLEHQLEPFRRSMSRRFQRDVDNLKDYYRSLEQEMRNNLENPNLSDKARQDRQAKIESLPAEQTGKIEDLHKKYTVRVRLRPAAAMLVNSPSRKIVCRMSRGKSTGQLFLIYNPVTRSIDPPACSGCGKPVSHVHLNADLASECLECHKQDSS